MRSTDNPGFATAPLTGNGLAVFLDSDGWSHSMMQGLTREMKQFESIFLSDISPAGATARVFTVEEELPFAGHPVPGAAAVLHRTRAREAECRSWTLRLSHGTVAVTSKQLGDHYLCEMNQGAAVCGGDVAAVALKPILARLGLAEADLVSGISAKVISTGLPYLIVPVRPAALARAAIQGCRRGTRGRLSFCQRRSLAHQSWRARFESTWRYRCHHDATGR